MREPITAQERRPPAGEAAPRERAARAPAGPAAHALALQRAVGNRAAARLLARWQKHPDAEQKGVMVPDVVAEDHTRFNPPQNA